MVVEVNMHGAQLHRNYIYLCENGRDKRFCFPQLTNNLLCCVMFVCLLSGREYG